MKGGVTVEDLSPNHRQVPDDAQPGRHVSCLVRVFLSSFFLNISRSLNTTFTQGIQSPSSLTFFLSATSDLLFVLTTLAKRPGLLRLSRHSSDGKFCGVQQLLVREVRSIVFGGSGRCGATQSTPWRPLAAQGFAGMHSVHQR